MQRSEAEGNHQGPPSCCCCGGGGGGGDGREEGPEQSSPYRKCAGEAKGEGEGDSGESGPLATSALPWEDLAKGREMAQQFFHGIGQAGQPDQSSPSASGQPLSPSEQALVLSGGSQDADPNPARMPSFDGHTDSAKVTAIKSETS